jgi:peptide-methionine (R)-S-oxide reductase
LTKRARQRQDLLESGLSNNHLNGLWGVKEGDCPMINRRALLTAGVALAALLTATRNGEAGAMTTTETIDYRSLSDAEWRKRLTAYQYDVLRKHGTERAGTSPLNREKRKGIFACAGCDLPLFSSDTKFESGTGWPSFYQPLPDAVETKTDRSFFMTRTEVHCKRCLGHLGHVFDDGPPPTGLRYCMNGVALKFEPQAASSS